MKLVSPLLLCALVLVSSLPAMAQTSVSRFTCDEPNHDARMLSSGVPVNYVPGDTDGSFENTVSVVVTLNEHGSVRSVALRKSSGDRSMDNSALIAAMRTLYTPKVVNCVPRSGSFIFRAHFDGPPVITGDSPGS